MVACQAEIEELKRQLAAAKAELQKQLDAANAANAANASLDEMIAASAAEKVPACMGWSR